MERRWMFMIFLILSFPASMLSHASYVSQVYHSCSTTSAATTSYTTNLHSLISSLVQQAPLTGFNISVVSSNPPSKDNSTVYGLAQCRGDLSEDDCKQCLFAISAQLLDMCPDSKAAKLQLDGCFLGYSNSDDIFYHNSLKKNKIEYQSCSNEANEKTQQLQSNINRLVLSLTAETPLEKQKFAYNATGSGLNKVYGLAQCELDLSTQDCASCLSFVASQFCENNTVGAAYYSSYCCLRFEKYAFFNAPNYESAFREGSTMKASNHHSNAAIIIGIIGATIVLSAACLASAFILRGKLGSTHFNSSKEANREYEFDPDIGPSIFMYKAISSATRNFHEHNKIGKGGFGEVYKGVFPDGREIAAKRLTSASPQATKDFLNEVKLNSCIQHKNLLKLLGCCTEGSEMILVYEYMQNRSLDYLLFGGQSELFLDWRTRRSIIIGVARGLSYLHEDSQVPIVHRDIKLGNILVDKNFIPKIGDFGLALHYRAEACNAKVAGTLGYIPPECAMRAKLTKKVDIFSFGVLTLEIISGRRNKDLPNEMQYLLDWAWRKCEEGRVEEVIDRRLMEWEGWTEEVRDEVVLFIHMALLCAQEDAGLRPGMGKVVLMMSGVADLSTVPVEDEESEEEKSYLSMSRIFSGSILSQEALQRAASLQHRFSMSRRPRSGALHSTASSSNNVITMSEVEPR